MNSIVEIKNTLNKNKSFIFEKYHVERLGIFGSYIRGEQTDDSDIDILVEFKKDGKDFFNYLRLKKFLEQNFDKKVDLVMKEAIKLKLKKIILDEVQYD
jgi:hypothetical protein